MCWVCKIYRCFIGRIVAFERCHILITRMYEYVLKRN